MNKRILVVLVAAMVALPLATLGCKGKVESDMAKMETPEAMMPTEAMPAPIEPAETVATETIPPTAAPQIAVQKPAVPTVTSDRNKDIQTALSKAGFYTGAIDGKIGPKTKKAIEEFQRTRGLKVDGKVGPKTWAELEKELIKQ